MNGHYLVLARKFRPQNFSEVTGQEQVTKTLANAITRGKIAHAYLFCGPRGVGKTSIARIFSKSLNCDNGPTSTPCGECANCVGIRNGTSLAVREIDGASNNSVDNVRELIDSFRSVPPPGSRYKIYIIDEVHMLSTSAFNALLKSLEEPPPHTVFILATTEAHKIPETVISRCQRHDFRALTVEEVESRLAEIAEAEGMAVEVSALRLIARLSEGSMRDAQSLLDRIHSFCEGKITLAETSRALGVVERSALVELSKLVIAHDSAEVLNLLERIFASGIDPALFLKEFVAFWRELIIAKCGKETLLERIGLSQSERTDLLRLVTGISNHDVQDLAQLAREGADKALRSSYPRYALESLLVRMALREPVHELRELIVALQSGASPASTQLESIAAPVRSAAAPQVLATPPPQAPAALATSRRAEIARVSAVATAAGKVGDWASFVKAVGDIPGNKMLAEQLKRLSIEKFEAETLTARGPEFTLSYLNQADNKKKLHEALAKLIGGTRWGITLAISSNKVEPGSLMHQEEQRRSESQNEKARDIQNHPTIKTLQKAFPGSKIEDIRIKES